MLKPLTSAAAAAAVLLASCVPPPPVPPPRFNPNPPYPPQQVDSYGEPSEDSAYQEMPSPTPSPQPQQSSRPGDYPTAQRTANPDQVISPYEPYNVIDVAGFRSGQLARDPSNQKIFRVP